MALSACVVGISCHWFFNKSKPNLLEGNYPEDLKKMTDNELDLLSYEIRDFLIDKSTTVFIRIISI